MYHRDPESKMESMLWKHKTSPTPKMFRVEKSAGKVMATVFWDEKGLLLLEFMPQKTTITGQTYANTITALREAIKEKRREKLSAGVLLLHDNAPVHMSAQSQAAIQQCGFQQLNHPPFKTLGLKNLLTKTWEQFSGKRKDFCFYNSCHRRQA